MASIDANKRHWDRISGTYQQDHDPQIGASPRLWGMFSIPDEQLGALGNVAGKRVLELGCGAGQWSHALAEGGSSVVALDLSGEQLHAARTAMGDRRYPLVQGAAEQLPFAGDSFEVVFCDHGGLSWAPPAVAIPEAARVLRPGGQLIFNTSSPWLDVCYDDAADAVTSQVRQRYFTLERRDEGDGAASYQLTYGGWIRTLRQAGLIVDDLIEPRPDRGQLSSYLELDPPDWAHHWPAEMLWVTHKPSADVA